MVRRSQEERAELTRRAVELHEKGWGRNHIGRQLGIAPATVSVYLNAVGATYVDDERLHKLHKAAADSAKLKRENLREDMYITALDQAARLAAGSTTWRTVMRGERGVESAEQLSYIPARDLQQAANGVRVLVETIARLEQMESPGAAHATGLLSGLAAQLGLRKKTP